MQLKVTRPQGVPVLWLHTFIRVLSTTIAPPGKMRLLSMSYAPPHAPESAYAWVLSSCTHVLVHFLASV